jgi:hypothetical protein
MVIGWFPKERLVGERLTAAAVPVPVSPRDWGLPAALSVMLTDAARLPLTVGSKVTLIVQLVPAATELPHVLVSAKSPGLAPVRPMLERLTAALPPLVRVAVNVPLGVLTGWLPKQRLVGERLTAVAVPVPERLTVWGLPAVLSVILTDAVRLPLAVGSKVTLIVQLAPTASELPQLLVWAKSPALAPVIVTLEIFRVEAPVLLRVAVPVPLVVPTGWFPKERLPGETLPVGAAAATPIPLRPTFLRPPQAVVQMLSIAERQPVVLGVKVRLIVQLVPGASELPQLPVRANRLA